MSIIAISGKIGSGKDTVGKIIQYITDQYGLVTHNDENYEIYTFADCVNFIKSGHNLCFPSETHWEIKKFADKLKDIVCLLINCTREQLEDEEFKNKELGEEWWTRTNGMFLLSQKDFVNQIAGEYDTTVIKHKFSPRLLLQIIGTDLFRKQLHPDIWVNSLMNDYKSTYPNFKYANKDNDIRHIGKDYMNSAFPNWIITDVRFPNELQAVKQKGGISIQVNRPFVVFDGIGYNSGDHPSETALDHITDWDYVIDNSGTIEDLVKKVEVILVNEKII